ncbi:MAG: dihydroorotase [Eubacteriales bacterium]|nr:dihydroorotase [Eubacteriales bacterium]
MNRSTHLREEEILIRGARVVDPYTGRDEVRDIAIADGRYVDPASLSSPRIIETDKLVAVPGLSDIHVHLREPGFEYKEDVVTGTHCAARGGFTHVASMPNTNPTTDTPEIVQHLIERAERDGYCEVTPIAAATKGLLGEELSEMGLMHEAGAVAFSDDGRPVESADMMQKAMNYAQRFGARIHSHCEVKSLCKGASMNESQLSTEMGLFGSPKVAEDLMIIRDILLADYYHCPIHICHVSTKTGLELIREAKKRGVAVSAETCPHYFILTEEAVRGYNTHAKMHPPLREEEDRLAVIEALKDGTIDCIVTDHAPHHRDEKDVEFALAANGIIGLETAFPLAYSYLVKTGELSLMELLKLMISKPRAIVHQAERPIEVGGVADLMLFDPEAEFTYSVEESYSKSRNTPFDGWRLHAPTRMTIWRGRISYEAGFGGKD